MRNPFKSRTHRMKRLSTLIDPMVAPSARERGFTIERILSQWQTIAGDMSSWCRPDAVSFPKKSPTNGSLRLRIAPGRGPQAQAMSKVIIDRVNANFGYQAISRISLTQTFFDSGHSATPTSAAKSNPTQPDIWTLDDKLKDVKSPELRAALRRLGSPISSFAQDEDDTPSNKKS